MYSSTLETPFNTYKELHLEGRYITNSMIEPLLEKLPKNVQVTIEGTSVKHQSIYCITLGSGKKRVLMWSQMHGNESTTTKALFDLINYLQRNPSILEACTLCIIPILNPDGAQVYTRLNANQIDLNRDAQALSQPESRLLKDCFLKFKPDFCFNLHGQRTIFSVGETSKSAILSFLSPAEDESRSFTKTRKIAMELIVAMNLKLQKVIPNQVALYNDGFNHNCVGDAFQSLGVPTVLFEAGHYPGDYKREVTRELIGYALMIALYTISETELEGKGYEEYLMIPQNGKCFLDVIIRNVEHDGHLIDVGVQYKEELVGNSIQFIPEIVKLEKLDGFFGHKEYDGCGANVLNMNGSMLSVGNQTYSVMLNNAKYSLILA
ncbi:peptidase M14 [Bizionia argentinensis JUB59]|uniref:Peptidase M14 n=1 Tax=Bizionia argentinensis JUB59 TaxID=1046627 RepID=G2E995_9FLAO|nr:M14 metallopeptidase family protein [Bizionia argentinensis]EGV45047.1 peptidase M14 [Bizionia argentinensis JUB59]